MRHILISPDFLLLPLKLSLTRNDQMIMVPVASFTSALLTAQVRVTLHLPTLHWPNRAVSRYPAKFLRAAEGKQTGRKKKIPDKGDCSAAGTSRDRSSSVS